MAETIPATCIHTEISHQSQIKEDTGEPTLLAREINLRAYSQDIPNQSSAMAQAWTWTCRCHWLQIL